MFATSSWLPSILALAVAVGGVKAQGDLSDTNNITSLEGTWSSNVHVQTGGAFCNPANYSFTYPTTTGISYSFTDTGFFEEAQYRFTSNATNPTCITAYILWQHGTYQLNNNGSMTLYPFPSDGRIQVQDPCAAVTNLITEYNQVTLYADWGIIMDSTRGNYKLELNRFDGAKMPPMWLTANPPNMLPTQYLTGVNASGQAARKRDLDGLAKRSAAAPGASLDLPVLVTGTLAALLVGAVGLVL
ncbi:Reversal of tor2 lethality [Naganishia albida]|nr:Reversal of tor2 lethality [Naganishia albida]